MNLQGTKTTIDFQDLWGRWNTLQNENTSGQSCYAKQSKLQSRTQSPQALWPAVGRQERLGGTGILLPQDFFDKTMQAVTEQKKIIFFEFSRISTGDQPLAKEPEDSWYEIDQSANRFGNTFKSEQPVARWIILSGKKIVLFWRFSTDFIQEKIVYRASF